MLLLSGGPPGITGFNPYPRSTVALSRSQARQYSWQALQFAAGFHQELTEPATDALGPIITTTTWGAGITAYRGSTLVIIGTNRGGWHLSYPPLIPPPFFRGEKPLQSKGTPGSLFALSRIEKFSRLLRPVGPGLMSQSPSGGYCSHSPYPLSPCWFVTPTAS